MVWYVYLCGACRVCDVGGCMCVGSMVYVLCVCVCGVHNVWYVYGVVCVYLCSVCDVGGVNGMCRVCSVCVLCV